MTQPTMDNFNDPATMEKLANLSTSFLNSLEELYENDPVRISAALDRTLVLYIHERVKEDKVEQFLSAFFNNLRTNIAILRATGDIAPEQGEEG